MDPVLKRLLSILVAGASTLIVFGEMFLFIDFPIGVFPLFFAENHGMLLTQGFCLLCLMYFIYCTFVALFRLKLKGRYGLYKDKHTDPPNLLWSAFIMARMTPPLCYNFLLFIKVQGTQFEKVMGVMDLVPILGKGFTIFFPAVLTFFVLLNIFNAYSWLMAKMAIPQFGFSDGFDEDEVKEGKWLIAKERGDERTSRSRAAGVRSSSFSLQSKKDIHSRIRDSLREPFEV